MRRFLLLMVFAYGARSEAGATPAVDVPLMYSAVLEFNQPPVRAARGDLTAFSVERSDARILVRPLRAGANTNLVLFFPNGELFQVLLSSKGSEPGELVYRFDFPTVAELAPRPKKIAPANPRTAIGCVGMSLTRATSTSKGDYINVSVEIKNECDKAIEPGFAFAAITNGEKFVTATKAKSDRRVLEPGAHVLAHFEFTRPALAKSFSKIKFILPVKDVGRLELPLTNMGGVK